MKFLAVDTSAKYLSVIACNGDRAERLFLPECGARHSTELMGQIERALTGAGLLLKECDYIAVCTGPGSFTGIRIGISTVKGLCFACEKKALSVTSFDVLAYAGGSGKLLALVDAMHGYYYACPYEGKQSGTPAYLSRAEVEELILKGYSPVACEELFAGCKAVNPCDGLYAAALKTGANAAQPELLTALYLRKSSAEEARS